MNISHINHIDSNQKTISKTLNNNNYLKNYTKAQHKMTNMLKAFVYICRKYDITYWCSDETFVGATRNCRWLPFSNEVSISMIFSDYMKFKMKSNEMPETMWIQDVVSDSRHKSIIYKIRDKNSCYLEEIDSDSHNGLCINIYIYEINNDKIQTFKNLGDKFMKPGNCYRDWDYTTIFPLKHWKFEGLPIYIPNDVVKYSKTIWAEYPPISLMVKNPLTDIDPDNASDKCKTLYNHLYPAKKTS